MKPSSQSPPFMVTHNNMMVVLSHCIAAYMMGEVGGWVLYNRCELKKQQKTQLAAGEKNTLTDAIHY
jgi:hypothetical protein